MSLLNLNKIISEVRARIHNNSLATDKITRWANIALDRIVRKMDPDWLEETTTFTTVANQRRYLIKDISNYKVKDLSDESSKYNLHQVAEKYIDEVDPGHIRKGRSTLYCIYGQEHVANQPSSASVITVVSSSASDITQSVQITGLNASGVRISEVLALNGIVSVSSTLSFTTVEYCSKSDETVGLISVTSNAGAVTLVTIPADSLQVQYQPIDLYPIPSSAYTIRVRYIRLPKPLVNDEDTPDLPEMWHDLVLLGTLQQAHEYVYEFDKANKLEIQFEKECQRLHNEQGNSRDNHRKIRLPSLVSIKRYKGRLPEPIG